MKKLFVVFISLNFIAATCGKKVEDVIPTLGAVSMKVNGCSSMMRQSLSLIL
jgi:hypothetical protein